MSIMDQFERVSVNPLDGIKARQYTVQGKVMDFYTIGQVGQVLRRSACTVRRWERNGVIPAATFLAPNPSGHPSAKRRLYSHDEITGMHRIAVRTGLLDVEGLPTQVTSLRLTEFGVKVHKLFRDLRERP